MPIGLPAQSGQRVLVQRGDRIAGKQDAPTGGAFQPGQHHQQAGLAGPGGADDADRLACRDVEIDAAQDVDRSGGGRHGQVQVPDLHQRRCGGGGNRRRRDGIHGGTIWRPRPVAESRDRVDPDRCCCWRVPVAGAAPMRLLVLGNSLTAGYGLAQTDGFQAQLAAALRADGHDVRIIDGAVSGDTTAGGLARLDWALGDGADAAIVELGANDGLRGIDPADMEANLTAILDKLAARHIPVLLTGMYAPPNLGAGLRRGVSCGVRPAGQAAGRAVRSVLPGRAWRPSRR